MVNWWRFVAPAVCLPLHCPPCLPSVQARTDTLLVGDIRSAL